MELSLSSFSVVTISSMYHNLSHKPNKNNCILTKKIKDLTNNISQLESEIETLRNDVESIGKDSSNNKTTTKVESKTLDDIIRDANGGTLASDKKYK